MANSVIKESLSLSEATRRVFEPRAPRSLADEDLREITENMVRFIQILETWASPSKMSKRTHNKKGEQQKV